MESPKTELAQCADQVGGIGRWWNCLCRGLFDMEIKRYAIFGSVLVAILFGTYYLGYRSGANNTRVEYVTKEIEVVKYVNKEKSAIYSASIITRDNAIRLLENNQF